MQHVVLEEVRVGQRIGTFAVLAYFVCFTTMLMVDHSRLNIAAIVVLFLGNIVGAFAVVRMARGLGYQNSTTTGFAILQIVPIANWIILLYLSAKSTKFLERHGYQVELFGASKDSRHPRR